MGKRFLVAFGLWLARLGGWTPTQPDFGLCPLIDSAKDIITQTEISLSRASGEAKRHQVYASLLKKYPATSKRDIALAIELALRS